LDSSGGAISEFTFQNNFVTMGEGDVGITFGGNDAGNNPISNTMIRDNLFDGPTNMNSNPIRVGNENVAPTYDVGVSGLTFQGNAVQEGTIQIHVTDENITDVAITHNDFSTTDGAVLLRNHSGAGQLEDFSFENNDVSNTNSYGIALGVPVALPTEWTDSDFAGDIQVRAYGLQALSLSGSGITSTVIDASGNWWGSNVEGTLTSEITSNTAVSQVDYTPWLDVSTDTDGGAVGFQGDFSTLHVSAASPQVGATGIINEGIDLVNTDGTINILSGSYVEDVIVNKGLNLAVPTGTATMTSIVSDGGTTTGITGDFATNGGGFQFNGAAILAGDVELDSTITDDDIVFASTVDGDHSLTVNTGGVTKFQDAVGETTDLAGLTTDADGSTQINGGLVAATTQTYNDAVTLGADTTS